MDVKQILLKYWGYNKFRPLQNEIIESVLSGQDTLALMPTGGGKSICFQIPTLLRPGICIVISPLVALMKDQVENLTAKGIKAIALNSAMSKYEIDTAFENCAYGDTKFLYLSPERLESDLAKLRIAKMKVSLFAVDEAHCISQWGYDFRPSYLKIADIRALHPQVPVLALTATATPDVVIDIQEKLMFRKKNVFQKSFERKNLAYHVAKEEDKLGRLLKIIQNTPGCGIIYVRNRRKTLEITNFLRHYKISCDYYHAGLDAKLREQKQQAWIENKTRIMICTNAFGMGIDKSDVRFVVHMDAPDCIEAYFQEAGRAGRDEQPSLATLLYHEHDKAELELNLNLSFPPITEVRRVYQGLANYFQIPIEAGKGVTYEFDSTHFCSRYNFQPLQVFSILKFLEKENYIALTDAFFQPSRIRFSINKEALYRFQVEHPKNDSFIKLLLRMYAGVFDGFVKVSEQEIARRGELSVDAVKALLTELHKLQIIVYEEQSNQPRLTFLHERIDAKYLDVSSEQLRTRKEKTERRMHSMLHYAVEKTKCRSRVLLNYFGEQETYRCGICDICLERNKLDLSNLEFESVSNQVKELLSHETGKLEDIVRKIKDSDEEKIVKVIRWLIDNDKITHTTNGLLAWSKK